MENQEQPLHTEGVLGDYFVLETHILSTRSADGYKALDRTRADEPILLWMLRHPLAVNSEAVKRFLDRMYAIDQIDPAPTEMSAYGVDAEGTAFAIFPPLDGHTIISGNVEVAEAERRFISALRILKSFHENGIVCGDLCGSSFWVTRDGGGLKFIGTMGSFDSEAVATAMAPPQETLPFIAPEQRAGGGIEQASDVFALGVLGYYLLAREFPFGSGVAAMAMGPDQMSLRSVSSYVPAPPVWVDEVFSNCLASDPSQRYQSAGEVLDAITEIRERAYSEENVPVALKRDLAKRDDTGERKPQVSQFRAPAVQDPKEQIDTMGSDAKLKVFGLGALIVVALAVALLPGLFKDEPAQVATGPNRLQKELQPLEDMLPSDVNLGPLTEGSAGIEAKKEELRKLAESDDPISQEVLVKYAKDAPTVDERRLAENFVIERARRLGLMRSSEQVRTWLRRIRSQKLPDGYEPMLKILDKSLPKDQRDRLLRQAYVSSPDDALRVTVALALDIDQVEQFQPILSQLVGDALKVEDASEHSALGLILVHPDLALVFGEDVVQRRDQLPDQDILWLLNILSDRDDVNLRAIASTAVKREVLPPLRASLLQIIEARGDLPLDVATSLIRAAGGSLEKKDIASFGKWFDLQSEKVLLTIAADATYRQNKEVLQEIFDTLVGKSLLIEPSASLANWVRRNYWNKRSDFTHVIGVLANLDKVEGDELSIAFKTFDDFVKDSELIDILLESEQPLVIKAVVEEYPELLSVGAKLDMLENRDREVRRVAINALKGTNDIGALKYIIDAYQGESDPELRELYKENFWVIRKREEEGV